MRTTIGSAMRLVVVVMAMGFAACGGDPLDISGAGGAAGAGEASAPDAGAAGGAPAGDAGGEHLTTPPCTPLATGDTITDETGAAVVNARCDRQCSSSLCLTPGGDSVWCSFCAKAPPPPCPSTIVEIDSCQAVPGTLCCYTCYTDEFVTSVRGCTGVTGTGKPVVCATSIDDCR